MNDENPASRQLAIHELLSLFWSSRYTLAVGFLLGASAGIAHAYLAPSRYVVSAVALVTERGVGSALSGLAGLAGLAGVSLPNMGGDTRQAAEALMQSRGFCLDFAERVGLVADLFVDEFDASTGKWRNEDPDAVPTLDDACRAFRDQLLEIDFDDATGVITLSVTWTDSEKAARWINDYVGYANMILQQKALANSENALVLLRKELESASSVEVRTAIGGLIQQHMGQMVVARGTPSYALDVIDAARPKLAQDRDWPRRRVSVIAGVAAGLVLAVMLIVLKEAARRTALPRP